MSYFFCYRFPSLCHIKIINTFLVNSSNSWLKSVISHKISCSRTQQPSSKIPLAFLIYIRKIVQTASLWAAPTFFLIFTSFMSAIRSLNNLQSLVYFTEGITLACSFFLGQRLPSSVYEPGHREAFALTLVVIIVFGHLGTWTGIV